jgi:hypothetical protein
MIVAGIDKIVLHTKEFEVKDSNLIRTQGEVGAGAIPAFLYRDGKGVAVMGKKSFFNGKRVNVDIDGRGMRVSLNPSKILHPYELLTDMGKLKTDIIRQVEKELSGVSISTNLFDCQLTRVDLTKQAVMSHPVSSYADGFSYLHCKFTNRRSYPFGYYFSNKNAEVVYYDKGEQLKDKSLKNFMRAEEQFKNKEIIQRKLGIVTLDDLAKTDCDYLTGIYDSFMCQQVFNNPHSVGQQLGIDYNGQLEKLIRMKEEKPRGAVKEIICDNGVEAWLLAIGGMDSFKRMLIDAGFSRAQMYRQIRDVQQMLNRRRRDSKEEGKLTVFDLVEEVRIKFAA